MLLSHINIHKRIIYSVIIILFLIVSVGGVYHQVRNFAFLNFDDDESIIENKQLRTGSILERVKWCFTTSYMNNWLPLTWLGHMTVIESFGMDAGKHHLVNVFFHLVNSILLFIVFLRISGGLWQSGFIAALFALHPLHVESVAWVTELKDVLSAFFFFLPCSAMAVMLIPTDVLIF